jgi:hypothetical protein
MCSSLRSRMFHRIATLYSCLLLLRSLCSLRIFTAFIFARCIFAPLSICYDSVLRTAHILTYVCLRHFVPSHSLCSFEYVAALLFNCIVAALLLSLRSYSIVSLRSLYLVCAPLVSLAPMIALRALAISLRSCSSTLEYCSNSLRSTIIVSLRSHDCVLFQD